MVQGEIVGTASELRSSSGARAFAGVSSEKKTSSTTRQIAQHFPTQMMKGERGTPEAGMKRALGSSTSMSEIGPLTASNGFIQTVEQDESSLYNG